MVKGFLSDCRVSIYSSQYEDGLELLVRIFKHGLKLDLESILSFPLGQSG